MIAFKFRRLVLILSGLGLLLVHLPATARGDAMQPWSGASATASSDFNGSHTQQSKTGDAVMAADGWGATEGDIHEFQHYAFAFGASDAYTGRGVNGFLNVEAGTNLYDRTAFPVDPHALLNTGTSTALASWSRDSVSITPPPGSPMPDSIRLQFGLTISSRYVNDKFNAGVIDRTVQVRANDTTIGFNSAEKDQPGYDLAHPTYPGFDSVSDTPAGRVGTFHLDLPLDRAGTSIPLNLALEVTSHIKMPINNELFSSYGAALNITDVTFADGTSLASRGYSMSFASGLSVPEPTSIALWSVVTIAGAWAARRRSRG